MTSTILIAKSAIPVPPNAGDIRGFFNSDGIWCSEDENGVVTVYAGSSVMGKQKAGRLFNSDFTGSPKKATVTFTAPLATPYAVNVAGVDSRVWKVESMTTAGFIINASANLALTGDVYWEVQQSGEF
jgi:hypothetical protein